MFKYIPQYEIKPRQKDISNVVNQLESGWIGPHTKTEDFEKKITEVCGVRYCVSTTSGTTALIMALKSLDLPSKSIIAFPDYTFLAGANAAKFLGYQVDLIDVNYTTLCMDSSCLNRESAPPQVVIFVGHNGFCGMPGNAEMNKIKTFCLNHNIPLIEDLSQCIGIFKGLIGDVGVLSFSVPKLITTGQGGAVITNDSKIYNQCLSIRDHGGNLWRKTRIHSEVGVNFRFNDILASFGLSQLEDVEEFLFKRDRLFDWYRNFELELVDFNYKSTWMVVYRSDGLAAKIVEELKINNIEAKQYYAPVHCNLPYKTVVKFPISEKLFHDLVYLPSSLCLEKYDVERICKIVKSADTSLSYDRTIR